MCSRCLCNYLSLLASRGFAIQIHSCPAAKASDIKYADLDQSTPLHAPNPEKYRTTPGDFFLSYQSLVCKRDAGYEPGSREFESLRGRGFLKCPCRRHQGQFIPAAMECCPKGHLRTSHYRGSRTFHFKISAFSAAPPHSHRCERRDRYRTLWPSGGGGWHTRSKLWSYLRSHRFPRETSTFAVFHPVQR